MMTKYDLIRIVERKRHEVLESLNKEYQETLIKIKEQIYSSIDLEDRCEDIAGHLFLAAELFRKVEDDAVKCGIKFETLYSAAPSKQLETWSTPDYWINWMKNHYSATYGSSLEVLYNTYTSNREEIKHEYGKVIAYLKSVPMSQGRDYLTNLGFTNIAEPRKPQTAMVPAVNPNILFQGGKDQ